MQCSGIPIHQGFLPSPGQSRAFVWKYTPVNWGRRPRHFHREPEFNLITAGRAVFGVGDTLVTATKNDLLIFPPGQDHVIVDASPDLFLYAIGMDPAFSSEVLPEPDALAGPARLRLTDEDFTALVKHAADIVDRAGMEDRCAELWSHAQWTTRRRDRFLSRPLHVLTRRTLALLAEDPRIGLEALAQRLRAPTSEISRAFHHDMGTTFIAYRTRSRLLRFIRAVDQGATNLQQIAREAGFGSYSQCHRVFATTLGSSPRAFFHGGDRERMQQAYDP
jgi:AraC-like DNA-binding protein